MGRRIEARFNERKTGMVVGARLDRAVRRARLYGAQLVRYC